MRRCPVQLNSKVSFRKDWRATCGTTGIDGEEFPGIVEGREYDICIGGFFEDFPGSHDGGCCFEDDI